VLDGGGDDAVSAALLDVGRAENGEVVRFGAARGEDDLSAFGAQRRQHLSRGLRDPLFGGDAPRVQRRGVSIFVFIMSAITATTESSTRVVEALSK
jgi:hypothetical protein